MAIPFKVENFRLEREIQLTREICANPLCKRVRAGAPEEAWLLLLQGPLDRQMLVPEGASARLDWAISALRTRTRLNMPVEAHLLLEPREAHYCAAQRRGGSLVLVLGASLLEAASPAELFHHLAEAAFDSFDPLCFSLSIPLLARAPFELHVWLKAQEWMRLRTYMAHCFALACTGDIETAIRAAFRGATERDPGATDLDFRRLAHARLAGGGLPAIEFVRRGEALLGWLPALPLVLEAFLSSELYNTCNGSAGGTPRAEFEAATLDLDRRMHPPLCDELPEDVATFLQAARFLATLVLMEAQGPLTPENRRRLLQTSEAIEIIESTPDAFDWNSEEPGENLKRFAALVDGPKRSLAHLLCPEILNGAIRTTQTERGHVLHAEEFATLERIGSLCDVPDADVRMIIEAFADESSGDYPQAASDA